MIKASFPSFYLNETNVCQSLLALIISKIKCRRVIDDDGQAHCLSACADKPLTADDLTAEEYTVGDRQLLLSQ